MVSAELHKRGFDPFFESLHCPKVCPKNGTIIYEAHNMRDANLAFETDEQRFSPPAKHCRYAFQGSQFGTLGPMLGMGRLIRGPNGLPANARRWYGNDVPEELFAVFVSPFLPMCMSYVPVCRIEGVKFGAEVQFIIEVIIERCKVFPAEPTVERNTL